MRLYRWATPIQQLSVSAEHCTTIYKPVTCICVLYLPVHNKVVTKHVTVYTSGMNKCLDVKQVNRMKTDARTLNTGSIRGDEQQEKFN